MSYYYVDPAEAGNAEDGGGGGTDPSDPTDADNWDDAFPTLADAVAVADAGDIVYCRNGPSGTDIEEPTAAITFDSSNDGNSAARIRYIGCGGLNGVDGTRYKIDWGTTVDNGLEWGDYDYVNLEHFELVSSQAGGGSYSGLTMVTNYAYYPVLINVWIHGWPEYGLYNPSSGLGPAFLRCKCTDNGEAGLYTRLSMQYACTFADNGSYGFYTTGSGLGIYECLGYSNWSSNFGRTAGTGIVNGCVSHACQNTSGTLMAGGIISGFRATDSDGYGLNITKHVMVECTYMQSNSAGGMDDDAALIVSDTVNGSDVTESGTDTDYGYVDSSSDDYNLDPDEATYYSEPRIMTT